MGVKTARMAEKEGNEPSQALPRQLSQRESQAVTFVAKVLGTTRKLSGVLLALPLGELSPQVTERAHAVNSVTKVSIAMRNLAAMPKAPPERKDSPRPGGDVAQRQKGESGTPSGVTERVQPRPAREGAHPLYDRIMNLSKHFCKALDSTGKLAIMVLALRNKEC